MRRTKRIKLRLVPVVAAMAMASGCDTPQPSVVVDQLCVDGQTRRVEDERCKEEDQQRQQSHSFVPFYHWYYITRGANTSMPNYAMGGVVSGGSHVAPAHSSGGSRPSSVSRGGFGGSYHGTGGS